MSGSCGLTSRSLGRWHDLLQVAPSLRLHAAHVAEEAGRCQDSSLSNPIFYNLVLDVIYLVDIDHSCRESLYSINLSLDIKFNFNFKKQLLTTKRMFWMADLHFLVSSPFSYPPTSEDIFSHCTLSKLFTFHTRCAFWTSTYIYCPRCFNLQKKPTNHLAHQTTLSCATSLLSYGV